MIHFIAVQLSYAMENENNKLRIIKKLTAIEYPICVKYLTKALVVVIGDGCSIVNLLTNEEKKISKFGCSYLAVHPTGKKIAFSHHKTVEIYNTETNKNEWVSKEKYPIQSCDFSLDGNTLFLCLNEDHKGNNVITKRNYLENSCGDDDIRSSALATIAFHPKQQIMYMTEMWGNVSIYQSSNLSLEPKVIKLLHYNNPCQHSSQISPDGLIVVGDSDGQYISFINQNLDGCVNIESERNEVFIRMLFYPRGLVLATSSLLKMINKHIMRYWDAKTLQLIHTTQPLKCDRDYDFAFSPDGKEIIIAFEEECLMFQVPFEVRYENGTKEKFPYKLFLLKKYIDKHQEILDQEIPEDVKLLLANTLFKTFER